MRQVQHEASNVAASGHMGRRKSCHEYHGSHHTLQRCLTGMAGEASHQGPIDSFVILEYRQVGSLCQQQGPHATWGQVAVLHGARLWWHGLHWETGDV